MHPTFLFANCGSPVKISLLWNLWPRSQFWGPSSPHFWFATFMSHLAFLTLGFTRNFMNCQQIIWCHFVINSHRPHPLGRDEWKNLTFVHPVEGHCVFCFYVGVFIFLRSYLFFPPLWHSLTSWWEGIHSLHGCQEEGRAGGIQQNGVSEACSTGCEVHWEDRVFRVGPELLQAGGILSQLLGRV